LKTKKKKHKHTTGLYVDSLVDPQFCNFLIFAY
jgi:hypothetical protein